MLVFMLLVNTEGQKDWLGLLALLDRKQMFEIVD